MKNQSNKIVILEWLLPLLDQQLAQVSDDWQLDGTSSHKLLSAQYQQITGVLTMANLPRLSSLAMELSQLADQAEHEPLSSRQKCLAQFAQQRLRDEFIHYVQTGVYRYKLIDSTISELQKIMSQTDGISSQNYYAQLDYVDDQGAEKSLFYGSDTFNTHLNIVIPSHTASIALQKDHYQQLLVVWRQQIKLLLMANDNKPDILQSLIKVSHYLWQSQLAQDTESQQLWYLTELWLSALLDNSQPLPSHYAQLLSRLEQALEAKSNSAENNSEQTEQKQSYEPLITDIYVQLNALGNITTSTQSLLNSFHEPTDTTSRFLTRILTKLETVIFGLDDPQALTAPLQLIQFQLEQRGWISYGSQAAQILTELTDNMSTESTFVQVQSQIESQLQELYYAIANTESAIQITMHTTTSFATYSDTASDKAQSNTESVIADAHDNQLRQLRLAFGTIKHNFSDFLQQRSGTLMSSATAFADINDFLIDESLSSIQKISNELDTLFAQIVDASIKSISLELMQTLTAIVAILEHLIDYLAHQVLDKHLVQQGYEYIEQAKVLLAAKLAAPDSEDDDSYIIKMITTDVPRYDDSGEIAAFDDAALETEMTANDTGESMALHLARRQVKADDLQVDESIRGVFIAQATEIISDLADFLPIWQEDSQDLTALTEVRRNFYALKESGKIAGAFSISTLAYAFENLLNAVLNDTLIITPDLVTLILRSKEQLATLMENFSKLQPPSIDLAYIVLQSNNLIAGLPLTEGMSASDNSDEANSGNDKNDIFEQDNFIESATPTKELLVSSPSAKGLELNIPAVLMPFVEQCTPLPTDADDADPDIKDIFIEEAEEVLAEITPLYKQWRNDTTDLTKLTEIRRGFHTLKGSGRMVGAHYSAELAWSIENLLNRLLDHSITLCTDIEQLIADVITAYPGLIAIFAEQKQDYPANVMIWVACATAYSQQHEEFSYSDWREQGSIYEHSSDIEPSNDADSNADITLQTIYSINEIMAEAIVLAPPQSEEEQAFYKIFVEEAHTLLQEITDFVQGHQYQDHVEVSDQIVRAFHTLRAASGSSALASISEISATIEHSLEQLQQHDISMTPQHLQALTQSVSLIEGYLSTYDQSVQQQQHIALEDEQSYQDVAFLQAMFDDSEEMQTVADNQLSVAQLLDIGIDDLLDVEWNLSTALNITDKQQVHTYIHQLREQITELSLKTLDSPKFITLLTALDNAYSYLDQNLLLATKTDMQQVLLSGHEQLIGLFDALAGRQSLKLDSDVIDNLYAIAQDNDSLLDEADNTTPSVQSRQADKLYTEDIDTDAELLSIFLEELQEIDSAVMQIFSTWRNDIDNTEIIKELQRHAHTVKGGAQMAGIRSIGQLTYESDNLYRSFAENTIKPTAQWVEVMQKIQETLSLQSDHISKYHQSLFADELVEQCQQFKLAGELPMQVELVLPAFNNHQDSMSETVQQEVSTVNIADAKSEDDEADSAQNSVDLEQLIIDSWPNGQPDADILEVYLEEAEELISSSHRYLEMFLKDDNDIQALQSLQRDLHTMKGGARMVAANGIADLAHEMESVYEELARRRRPAIQMVFKLLTACHDWIVDAVFILSQQVNPLTPKFLITALQQFNTNPDNLDQIPHESLLNQRNMILAAKTGQKVQTIVKDINQMPLMTGSFPEQMDSASGTEMIRISGGLIEHMINLSGESAINRARIDMGMTSLTNSIEEMGITVQRLADQLRRMEVELEVQILAQIDETLIVNEDFDPLEMDQYSSLNQLSKSLSESASDLIDINSTLLEKTRDSESLLLQLSRTQTELQDGLMKSRIVPFTRLTPRLERIVRQTANELNKSVDLTVINTNDEIDRTILDRITSPLEHMLRNAVDHGIEDTQDRLKAGKDRSGHITLEVLREGNEVVINLSDDGRGINIDAVRKKAIANGLIDPNDDSLSDLDIMQYIFNAGLTTTDKLTQISGRGVGMDVVISEVRQLGGVVSVASNQGEGSQFTMRVPLSVAVTDALVVRVADSYYAIPLVQIERVVRVNSEKLYDYYQSGSATLSIGDDDYRIRYLNEILSGNKFNELMINTNATLPLIIIKSRTGQNLALQVDQIAGSRIEVVVKPLGRQLSHITGISAATIMGDGSVMLILDLIALMRNAPSLKDIKPSINVQKLNFETQPTVLVVDDSVTVRKVTSRFLERQGIKVLIAKDGIDAIEILQDTIPNLILLDIEMPRMDGFEVATQVRNSKRLEQIPIIMITSRTGEKHRERAFEIGVNGYMGKPFQEKELLKNIEALLGTKVSLDYDG